MTNLNDAQQKANESLYRALSKCRDAGLAVLIYDSTVITVPVDKWRDPSRTGHDPIGEATEYGEACTPPGLDCDGGGG